MKKSKFDHTWSGWKPKQATEHEYRQILLLSTATQRLEWLCSLLSDIEKIKLKKY